MKVICLYTGGVPELTQYKIYEAKRYTEDSYIGVINDNGIIRNYKSKKFKSLEEYRNEQIEKIII